MPRPINPPAMPPTAAPTAAPLNAARMGPAAMKGPTPGMAKAPMPAIHPNAPPMTPPVPAPVTAPSGALVFFSWAKSRLVSLSGNSTEMSLLEKFAVLSRSTICSAWLRDVAIQNTDFFDISFSFLLFCLSGVCRSNLVCACGGRFYFQLVIQFFWLGNFRRDFSNQAFFIFGFHGSTERNPAIGRDDLHVASVHGHILGGDNFLANLS